MSAIEVRSAVVGRQLEDGIPPVTFDWGPGRLTLRELISRAVEEQIRVLLAARHVSTAKARRILERQYLVETEIAARACGGKVAMPHAGDGAEQSPIDPGREIARALQAYEDGVYQVLVDGRQVAGLDEEINIGPLTRTVFLRLMPLAGG